MIFPQGSGVTLAVPNMEELEYVADGIRESDRRDMQGLCPDLSVKDILMRDVQISDLVYGVYYRGNIYGIVGVIPSGFRTGTPWVVGTADADAAPLPFARISRQLLDTLQAKFPKLETWICAENSKSVCWHRWCGFVFHEDKMRIGRDEYYRAVRLISDKKSKE